MAHLFDPMMNVFCELDEDIHSSSSHTANELAYDKKPVSSNINPPSGSKHVKWIDSYSDPRIGRQSQSHDSSSDLENQTKNSVGTASEFSCSSSDTNLQSSHHSSVGLTQDQQKQQCSALLDDAELLDVAVRTANLVRQNQQTLRELGELQKLTNTFLDEVMSNPGNERVALIWKRFKTDEKTFSNDQETRKANNSSGANQQ